MKLNSLLGVIGFTYLGLVLSSQAALITNGDFEEWGALTGNPPSGVPTGWTQSSTFSTNPIRSTGLLPESNFSALMRSGGVISQNFGSGLTQAELSFVFAATDPGGSNSRSFNLAITTENSNTTNLINLRTIQGSEAGLLTLQAFNGTGWTAVATDAFEASVYNSAGNSFSLLNAYSISLTLNLDATPSYSISYERLGGAITTVNDITAFQTAYTPGGPGATGISLMASSSSSVFALDDLAVVPEPTELALLTMGGVLLLLSKRRVFTQGTVSSHS